MAAAAAAAAREEILMGGMFVRVVSQGFTLVAAPRRFEESGWKDTQYRSVRERYSERERVYMQPASGVTLVPYLSFPRPHGGRHACRHTHQWLQRWSWTTRNTARIRRVSRCNTDLKRQHLQRKHRQHTLLSKNIVPKRAFLHGSIQSILTVEQLSSSARRES